MGTRYLPAAGGGGSLSLFLLPPSYRADIIFLLP